MNQKKDEENEDKSAKAFAFKKDLLRLFEAILSASSKKSEKDRFDVIIKEGMRKKE